MSHFIHSLIYLPLFNAQLPPQKIQMYQVQWIRTYPYNSNHQYRMICDRNQSHTEYLNNHSIYYCTPFDFGCFIQANIYEYSGQNSEYKIYKGSQRFGPIKMEVDDQQMSNFSDIKVFVNRKKALNAEFSIKTQKNWETSNQFLMIGIRIQQHSLIVGFDREQLNLCDDQIIKLYKNQPDCFGIYTYHQCKELLQFLRKLKVNCHYGKYLKIKFQNEKHRNYWIIALLSSLSNSQSLEQQDHERSVKYTPTIKQKQNKQQSRESLQHLHWYQTEKSRQEQDPLFQLNSKPSLQKAMNQLFEDDTQCVFYMTPSETVIQDIMKTIYTPYSCGKNEKSMKNIDSLFLKTEHKEKNNGKQSIHMPFSNMISYNSQYQIKGQHPDLSPNQLQHINQRLALLEARVLELQRQNILLKSQLQIQSSKNHEIKLAYNTKGKQKHTKMTNQQHNSECKYFKTQISNNLQLNPPKLQKSRLTTMNLGYHQSIKHKLINLSPRSMGESTSFHKIFHQSRDELKSNKFKNKKFGNIPDFLKHRNLTDKYHPNQLLLLNRACSSNSHKKPDYSRNTINTSIGSYENKLQVLCHI